MIETLILIIFVVGFSISILLCLSGRIFPVLLFYIPLLAFQNVIERLHKYPFGKDFLDIILLMIIMGWIIRCASGRERFLVKTPFNALLIIIVAYTYIGLWVGSYYFQYPVPFSIYNLRLQVWKNYAFLPLLCLVTVNNVRSRGEMKKLLIVMIAAMFVMDYYTLYQIKWGSGIVSRDKIDGTFVWAGVNVVAAFYAQAVSFLVGMYAVYKNVLFRVLSGILIAAGIYIIMFLFSRGAYLAIIAALFVIFLFRYRLLVVPLVILLMFWQNILPVPVVARINQTETQEGKLDNSSEKRIEIWKESMNLFKRNVVTGVGFNTVQYIGLAGGFTDTHNIYVKILAEEGIIGMLLMLILLVLAFRSGFRLYRNADDNFLKGLGFGFLACVTATAVVNIFGDRWTYVQQMAYFWVFLALCARGNIIVSEEQAAVIGEGTT